MRMQVEEVQCKTALNPIKSNFLPFRWDLNIYRGCSHACVYCFARYTHEYLGYQGAKDFEQQIKVKVNIAEVLEKQISSCRFKGGVISIGGISDVYQPLEKKYQLTRKCLEVIAKQGVNVSICTKSPLILRDLDLLQKIKRQNFCTVAMTVITLNQNLAQKLEPFAPPVAARIEALRKLKAAGIPVGLHLMPIMPNLTDNETDLRKMLELMQAIKIDYLISGYLNVRSSVRGRLFPFLQQEFPGLLGFYRRLYTSPRNSQLKSELRRRKIKIDCLIAQYHFSTGLKWPRSRAGARGKQMRLGV